MGRDLKAGRTGVIVFEGGRDSSRGHGSGLAPGRSKRDAPDDPRWLLAQVRSWTTLDTLAKFRARSEADVVILATDAPSLAASAAREGALIHSTAPDSASAPAFHFGRVLRRLVVEHCLERVVCLGGGSVPLLTGGEMDFLFERAPPGSRAFVVNSPQSPDVIAIGSAAATESFADLETDNAAVFALGDAGYSRVLLPETATATFDLDTPSDVLFLAYEARRRRAPPESCAREEATRSGADPAHPGAAADPSRPSSGPARPAADPSRPSSGPARPAADPPDPGRVSLGSHTAAGLASLDLDTSAMERACSVLGGRYPDVTLIGRVAGSTMAYLNASLLLRLRVFSEERGMKALGRIDRGEVRSLLGIMAGELGFERLVEEIAALSQAVFWDTRVIISHLCRWPDDSDRFWADVGEWERVSDPALREFARAVAGLGRDGPPFVLGGHSVVSGGLRLLVDGLSGRS